MLKPFSAVLKTEPPSFDRLYSAGRRVRNLVVSLRDSGQDHKEAEAMLRQVKKLCRENLEAWQPPQLPN